MDGKRRLKRNPKRGASLAMVLVSMTILVIMGTLFTTIAMRSYTYSYAKLCKQQAYYTAVSSINGLYKIIEEDKVVLSSLLADLHKEYEKQEDETEGEVDPTTVSIDIGSTGGTASGVAGYVPNGFFDTYMGECDLKVRYANAEMNEISLEAHAKYKGYVGTARAKVARTNEAASELKKIFDNTFCLQSPITTMVTSEVNGDIYISQPTAEYYYENDILVQSGEKGSYNKVLASLKETGMYGGYSALPGQYLRNGDGTIISDNSVAGQYNKVLKEEVYGKVQASSEDSTQVGHTKPIDVDNKPMQDGYYNDWVEFYMFSRNGGGRTAIDGNLYAHSRVLIGLIDKDKNNKQYIQTWDDTQKRRVFPVGASQYGYAQGSYYPEGGIDDKYEHGFSTEVFFDHENTKVLKPQDSKFRINGNMYLWETARIENLDSTQTENAFAGIKNNIYAMKDLYIDGFYITGWDGVSLQHMVRSRQVSVYGDVVVQGNAYISGADIYGDVYCYGDELTMADVNVYGNVYFAGDKFTADHVTIGNGSLTVNYNNDAVTHDLDGGNLVIRGGGNNTSYDSFSSGGFGTSADVGNNGSQQWGAVLTNCNVYGTLWSGVNTHIVCAKWNKEMDVGTGIYGNIFVDAYLFIDLTSAYAGGYKANWNGSIEDDSFAARWNCFERESDSQLIYAQKFQLTTNQDRIYWPLHIDVNELGTLLVGSGQFYIDGNESGTDEDGTMSVEIYNLFTLSNGKCWDTHVAVGNQKPNGNYYANTDEKTISSVLNGYSGGGGTAISTAMQSCYNKVISEFANLKKSSADEYKDKVFDNNETWANKVIKLRNWSAPKYSEDEEDISAGKAVFYHGGEKGFGNDDVTQGALSGAIDAFIAYLNQHPEAGAITGAPSGGSYTLTIKQSVCFNGKADFTAFDRVVFDSTEGNIHVKFKQGAVFGDSGAQTFEQGSDVVLRGGHMTFWYLYEDGAYDMNAPTLDVKQYTNLGRIEVQSGGYNADGLYIISNDDALIKFGKEVCVNGFIYAPKSHVFIEPGTTGVRNTLNGCMAIESYIMLTTADINDSWWNAIEDWWNNLWWQSNGIVDATIEQYKDCVYTYVMPPLIIDSGMQYGDTVGEVEDFGQVVWEFMGFY